MGPEIVSVIALALIFIIGGLTRINMGIIAFCAAAIIGFVFLKDEEGAPAGAGEILAGFPVSIFVLTVGVTLLTGVMMANGTIDWVVGSLVRLVRGRIVALPWMYFLIALVMATLGPGAVPFLVGLGTKFSKRYGMSPVVVALMIIHGQTAGAVSPLTPYGVIVKGLVDQAGIQIDLWLLWLMVMLSNVVVVIVAFFVFGGAKFFSLRGSIHDGETDDLVGDAVPPGKSERVVVGEGGSVQGGGGGVSPLVGGEAANRAVGATTTTVPVVSKASPRLTLAQGASLLGLLAFVVLTAVFQWDLGFTSIGIATLLLLCGSGTERERALSRVSWPAAWLISGVLLYVSVATKLGTVDWVVEVIGGVGTPLVAVLIACYIASIVSAVASSTAIITVTVALVLPFVSAGDLSVIGSVVAIIVCATIVDVSPFSAYGVMLLGAAEGVLDTRKLTSGLLLYTAGLALIAPLFFWLVLVVPGWLP